MSHPNAKFSTAERFEMKVDRSGECHRWTGSHNRNGYGNFWYEDRVRSAHIVALRLAGIDVPQGMTVDHVKSRGCQHRDCVRVDHLELVPFRENIRRSGNPAGINARKERCKRGHAYTAENSLPNAKGHRACRTCYNARRREMHREQREASRAA